MLKSLRAKVTLLVLVLGVPFLIGSIQGILYASEQGNLQERKSVAKRAFNRLARDLGGENPHGRIEELYEQSGLDSLGAGASLVDRAGNVLWESPHKSPGSNSKGTQQQVLDQGVLLLVMPEKQSENGLRSLAVLVMALGLAAYGTGAWLLVGATLKPVSKLLVRVKEAKGNPALKISAPSTDRELVNLVETLNHLIEEVRTEGEERINSYATLSHELRTPIHSLMLKLDLALGSDLTKEELEATLVEVQRQVYRLNHLSEAVLTLQRLSTPTEEHALEMQSLNSVIETILCDLQPLMDLKSLRLEQQLEQITLSARPHHIQLLVRNLLENAIKHCPDGSTVVISGSHDGDRIDLRISNPSDSERQMAGNGLGLRICREIVHANNWEMEAGEAGGVFTARVVLG